MNADMIFDQEYPNALAKIATSNTRDQKQAKDAWVCQWIESSSIKTSRISWLMNKLNLLECLSNLQYPLRQSIQSMSTQARQPSS
jgi:hypothetical protein